MISRGQEETNLKAFEEGRKTGQERNDANPYPMKLAISSNLETRLRIRRKREERLKLVVYVTIGSDRFAVTLRTN
jgi:hypothetical protein